MLEQQKDTLSRRAFVGRVATVTAGAAVALTATTVGRVSATPRHEGLGNRSLPVADDAPRIADAPVDVAPQVTETAPAPWEIVAPLAAGTTLNAEWKLAGLTAIADGSSVLTLVNRRGREQRVHLCRNDGKPQGLVYTERFDLVVMNGGRGDLPTEEGFGQAVAAIAHAIAANEHGARHDQVLAKLLPQTERVERFADTARLR